MERAGVRLALHEWPGPSPEGPWLLLLHGFRAHAGWWNEVAPVLARRYRVFGLDFSGHGWSGARASYPNEGYEDDVHAVVVALGAPDCIIAHSWGGHVALTACARWPDLTPHLIVVDSYFPREGDVLDPAIGNRRVRATIEDVMRDYRLSPPQPIDEELRSSLARLSAVRVDDGWRWRFDPDLIAPTLFDIEALRKIEARVDVMYAERSALVDASSAARMTAMIPRGAGPYVIPKAHHHPMFDQREVFVALLVRLLASP